MKYTIVIYIFTAVTLLAISLRNLTWNGIDEQSRTDRILEVGISNSTLIAGFLLLCLGIVMVFLSSDLRFTKLWIILGSVLLFLSIVSILVGIFGSFSETPKSYKLSTEVRSKRVKQRIASGVVILIITIVWIYSGVGDVI